MDEATRKIAASITGQREVGLKGDHWDNYAIAQGVLHDEIDSDSKTVRFPYRFDQEQRDALLAHARQDAAHALCNTGSLLKRIRTLTRLVYLLLAISLAILWRLYVH
jgi:hypothetical protein